MSTFCIIGGTGRTGQYLFKTLASSNENHVRVYVRDRAKLSRMAPSTVSQPNVDVFEGSITDVALLQKCIGHSESLFMVTAAPDNDPSNTVVQDTAHCVVAALSQMRHEDKEARLPQIIALSSATINPTFSRYTPRVVHFLLTSALNHKYDGLREMERYLKSHGEWLVVTFVQPGGLVRDDAKGHTLSLDHTKSFLSFADLANGMIEITRRGQEYEWKAVSVVPTGTDVKKNFQVPVILLKGYVWRFTPTLYHMVRRIQRG